MAEILKVKVGALRGVGKCYKRRTKNVNFNAESSDVYNMHSAVKTVLKEKILGQLIVDTETRLEQELLKINFDIPQAKDEAIKEARKLIDRCADWNFWTFCEGLQEGNIREVHCFDVDVTLGADLVSITDNVVECFVFKYKKPEITASGYSEDKGSRTHLPLYALLQYAKSFVPDGKKMTVKATFLYLRRRDDKPMEGKMMNAFTDGSSKSGNVITIQEDYTGGSTVESEFDRVYKWQFEEFYAGKTECTPEECALCDFWCACNYNKPPKRKDVKKELRPFSEITPTPAQQRVINHRSGVMLVNAGAGSGKTLTVALHVVTLLMTGVAPEHILLITFTKNAAQEMRERIEFFVDDLGLDVDMDKLTISTFNGFDNDKVLVPEYERFGFPQAPSVIEPEEEADTIARVLTAYPVDGLDYLYYDTKPNKKMDHAGAMSVAIQACKLIKKHNLSKGDGAILEDLMGHTDNITDKSAYEQFIEAYNRYDTYMVNEACITYDDQEYYRKRLLEQEPGYFDDKGYDYIIVDEFQDTSPGQIDLLKVLIDSPTWEELVCVGDDSQSIYSFRDTTNYGILHLEEILGIPVEQVYITENRRSYKEILELANKINDLNPDKVDKELNPAREGSGSVVVRGFFELDEEYQYISDSVEALLKKGTVPEDIGVIVRDRKSIEKIGTLLTKKGIQWVSRSPMVMSENSRVVAASALVRAYATPEATELYLPYLTCMVDGDLFSLTDEQITNAVEGLMQELLAIKALDPVNAEIKFMEMLEDIDEEDEVYEAFLDTLKRKPSLTKKLAYVRSYEKYGKDKTTTTNMTYPGVQLTTCHSSKGLEWKHVFLSLTGFDHHGLHTGSDYAKENLYEQRRLVFVGITRAKDSLVVTGQYWIRGYDSQGNPTEELDSFVKDVFEQSGTPYHPVDANRDARKAEKAAEKAAALLARKLKLGLVTEEELKKKAEEEKAKEERRLAREKKKEEKEKAAAEKAKAKEEKEKAKAAKGSKTKSASPAPETSATPASETTESEGE